MNDIVCAEDVISVIKRFYKLNEADEATTSIILVIGSDILDISVDSMLDLVLGEEECLQ